MITKLEFLTSIPYTLSFHLFSEMPYRYFLGLNNSNRNECPVPLPLPICFLFVALQETISCVFLLYIEVTLSDVIWPTSNTFHVLLCISPCPTEHRTRICWPRLCSPVQPCRQPPIGTYRNSPGKQTHNSRIKCVT